MTSTFRLYRPLSYAGTFAIGTALILSPQTAHAAGQVNSDPQPAIDPVTVAVVGVAVTATGLVVSWLDQNSEDVKAAAAVKSSGKHQGHTDFKADAGFSTAGRVEAEVDDMNGWGVARAYAHEGFFGTTISGAEYDVHADGFARYLESNPDKHHLEFEARASIDGTVQMKGSQDDKLVAGPGAALDSFDVKFSLAIDTGLFQLSQPATLSATASSAVNWSFSQSINGIERFYTSVSLDHLGHAAFGYHDGIAGIPEDAFTLGSVSDQYVLHLDPNASQDGKDLYLLDFFSETLTAPSAMTSGVEADGPTFSYSLSGVGQTNGHADDAVADVPEPASWSLLLAGFGALGAVMRRKRGSAISSRRARC